MQKVQHNSQNSKTLTRKTLSYNNGIPLSSNFIFITPRYILCELLLLAGVTLISNSLFRVMSSQTCAQSSPSLHTFPPKMCQIPLILPHFHIFIVCSLFHTLIYCVHFLLLSFTPSFFTPFLPLDTFS